MIDNVLQRWFDDGWEETKRSELIGADNAAVLLERDNQQIMLFFANSKFNDPGTIRRLFYHSPDPLMIMVAADLIDDQPFEPDDFLLVLHALYYGRVYSYRADGSLWAVHFERDQWDYDIRIPDWKQVQVNSWDFLVRDVDCLLSWFSGTFKIARPYDRKWWTPQEPPKQKRQSAWGQAFHPQAESPFDVLGVTMGASKHEIKAAYRRLARIWHPDINKSPEATTRMQAINAAYEKLQQWVTA